MTRDHFLFIHQPGESQFQVALTFTARIEMVQKTNNMTPLVSGTQREGEGLVSEPRSSTRRKGC